MQRGQVVESGLTDQVLDDPHHPYTQLLVSSIPRVSTTRDWAGEEKQAERVVTASGCKFADRCPVVMERCLGEAPPLFRTEPQRAVACFRHVAAPAEMAEVLAV